MIYNEVAYEGLWNIAMKKTAIQNKIHFIIAGLCLLCALAVIAFLLLKRPERVEPLADISASSQEILTTNMELIGQTEHWEIYLKKNDSTETAEVYVKETTGPESEQIGAGTEVASKPIPAAVMSEDLVCELPGAYVSILWNQEQTLVCIRYKNGNSMNFIAIDPAKRESIYHYNVFLDADNSSLFDHLDRSQTILLSPTAWVDSSIIRIWFSFFDKDNSLFQGTFLYDLITQMESEISIKQVSIGDGAYVKTGSLKDVSIEKLTEKEITTSTTINLTEYPLIAMLTEKDIYLYGAEDGVILKQGDKLCTFNWRSYLTPRFVLPILHSGDYDGDGTEELMCVLYVGSGTGVSISELHILEPESERLYRDILFEVSDYIEQLNSNIKYSYDKEKKLTFIIEGNEYEYETSEFFEEYTFVSIGYGDIIDFEYQDGIQLTVNPGFSFVGIAPPVYFGSVTAKVIYKDGTFTLRDFTIALDMKQ